MDSNEEKLEEVETLAEESTDINTTENTNEEDVPKEKVNVPIVVILSILLVIDVAVLVIYLIGIDKVLSFVK